MFMLKLVKAVAAILSVILFFPQAIVAAQKQIDKNYSYQDERMAYLETEFYGENYTPCDENKIADFDVEKAIEDGVKFNQVQFLATHNSYQIEATKQFKKLYYALGDLTFGIVNTEKADFTMDTLTEQFELGIRSVEIDIETVVKNGEIKFVVSHDPLLDNTSSCYDFEKALKEIKLWSDNNPNHLPITVIIEPKKGIIPINGMRNFTVGYANEVDKVIRDVMGDKLITPSVMMGDYESFKAMREADGWLELKDTLGKVLVLLHDTDVTDGYIEQDTSIKTQAMFPMLRFSDINESYASFIIDNNPADAINHESQTLNEQNLIVRTRADSFPNYSDDRYAKADKCQSQIITTDYPFRKGESDSHVYSFDGYTVKL